jgi:hypothetical protein
MNSPTISPGPRSISPPTPATESTRQEGPSKLTVRAKLPVLTAVRLATDQTVQLPDGRTLRAQAGDWLITRGRIVTDVVGASQLAERYAVVDEGERLLTRAICTRLEQTLGIGAMRNVDALIEAVERLAAISIGTIAIEFTPGQLEEIKFRATKRGQTVQQALQAVVDRIKDEIFWKS